MSQPVVCHNNCRAYWFYWFLYIAIDAAVTIQNRHKASAYWNGVSIEAANHLCKVTGSYFHTLQLQL